MNFAENALFTPDGNDRGKRTTKGKENGKIMCVEVREGISERRDVTWRQIRTRVAEFSSAMRATGVRKGDRVAVVASNSVDTLSVFLAVAAVGGLFSSSSTDMGVTGILDRLLQIRPRWVFVDDGALYNGKVFDLRGKMREIVAGMEGVSEFEGVVSLPRWREALDVSGVPRTVTLSAYLERGGRAELVFERVGFAEPFLIAYSSGTTGPPKCIVHTTGGVVLSSFKEGVLHRDMDGESTVLQYTTTGWIMYLASVTCMLQGVKLILYDGSPFLPDPMTLLKLVERERVTKLGVSPKWMQTLVAAGVKPREVVDVRSLKTVTSTGMVLPESLFLWFYEKAFWAHTQLANISGGTDVAAALVMENPLTPVYAGGCQGPSLGTAVAVYAEAASDASSSSSGTLPKGTEVKAGEPGELVVTKSFPTMPCAFFPGDAAAMRKYRDSYFGKYDDVWVQGDFVQVHPQTGQWLMLGRADGVLNPSGVRFGSAEIYNVIEQFFPTQIVDSICVGQRRETDDDERVMLFLKLQEGVEFTPALVAQVRERIAQECSKRHVPRYVFEIPEIPVTVNGKKVELPVKRIVSGGVVKASGTLLNPESLEFFYQFAKDEVLDGRSSRL